ncbi:hypothetical protein [Paraburkholderia fungorum]|uniref:hypothetical protein n=1 Tax=Paraburkholderia fungorum TaxID=134537 RepID=UPI001C1E95E1|nr:hypothetical protein [Paraburkholderia fungorum]MBU7443407.1 hypothetical protein [Paraburkholderia fungorum]
MAVCDCFVTSRLNTPEPHDLGICVRPLFSAFASNSKLIFRKRIGSHIAIADLIERQGDGAVLRAQLAGECKNFVSHEQQRQAAHARRDAILEGLARLGYEINDGMETAWARDGRVVVKNPALPGYGVEIGGQAEASRLQVRAVTLSANRDSARDKDVETLWCGDFGRLQELLVAEGDSLLIERALGVGEVPLKVIRDAESDTASVDKQRSLR